MTSVMLSLLLMVCHFQNLVTYLHSTVHQWGSCIHYHNRTKGFFHRTQYLFHQKVGCLKDCLLCCSEGKYMIFSMMDWKCHPVNWLTKSGRLISSFPKVHWEAISSDICELVLNLLSSSLLGVTFLTSVKTNQHFPASLFYNA